jgi:hypothetical protein
VLLFLSGFLFFLAYNYYGTIILIAFGIIATSKVDQPKNSPSASAQIGGFE